MVEILKLLKDLKDKRTDSSNRKRHNDDNNNNNQNVNQHKRKRSDVSKYFWTHGACGHTGKECKYKKNEHRDEATFTKKMEV